jgi:hypothetical protein
MLSSTENCFYRGQKLPIGELKILQMNVNGYLSMNTFISVSKSSNVALMYAGDGEERPQLESVVFEIEINRRLSTFANIQNVSYSKDENEVLFTVCSVFHIAEVVQHTDKICWITLVMDAAANDDMETLSAFWKKDMDFNSPLLNFTHILYRMGENERAERYCKIVDEQLNLDDQDRVRLYDLIGKIHQAGKADFQAAEDYYKRTIDSNKGVGVGLP